MKFYCSQDLQGCSIVVLWYKCNGGAEFGSTLGVFESSDLLTFQVYHETLMLQCKDKLKAVENVIFMSCPLALFNVCNI